MKRRYTAPNAEWIAFRLRDALTEDDDGVNTGASAMDGNTGTEVGEPEPYDPPF